MYAESLTETGSFKQLAVAFIHFFPEAKGRSVTWDLYINNPVTKQEYKTEKIAIIWKPRRSITVLISQDTIKEN